MSGFVNFEHNAWCDLGCFTPWLGRFLFYFNHFYRICTAKICTKKQLAMQCRLHSAFMAHSVFGIAFQQSIGIATAVQWVLMSFDSRFTRILNWKCVVLVVLFPVEDYIVLKQNTKWYKQWQKNTIIRRTRMYYSISIDFGENCGLVLLHGIELYESDSSGWCR